ncbi:PhzF family phenazine biosynthesis protein [Proteobacteria bacterium 005FR1]|nr:PhzF family phenazine biosynthesis protein [Proteobacteria bacterium 005FR1]
MSPDPGDSVFQVTSFVGEGCQGNLHQVYVNPQFASPAHRELSLEAAGDLILVLLFLEEGAIPRAEFYQFGRTILRCGSGSLAAAHVLLNELGFEALEMLQTDAGVVHLRERDGLLGYGDRTLPLTASEETALWQSLIDQRITSCWSIGSEHDYALVELESQASVRTLNVDIESLPRCSDRALIVTAAASGADYDYVLRYFAPQHGKAEDAATGSANLQLAPFWKERLGRDKLKGRQLSQSGGEFYLDIEGDLVWVHGRTVAIRQPKNP